MIFPPTAVKALSQEALIEDTNSKYRKAITRVALVIRNLDILGKRGGGGDDIRVPCSVMSEGGCVDMWEAWQQNWRC